MTQASDPDQETHNGRDRGAGSFECCWLLGNEHRQHRIAALRRTSRLPSSSFEVVVAYLQPMTVSSGDAGQLGRCHGLRRILRQAGCPVSPWRPAPAALRQVFGPLIAFRVFRASAQAFLMTCPIALIRRPRQGTHGTVPMGLLGTVATTAGPGCRHWRRTSTPVTGLTRVSWSWFRWHSWCWAWPVGIPPCELREKIAQEAIWASRGHARILSNLIVNFVAA